jgi:hypothetical protein
VAGGSADRRGGSPAANDGGVVVGEHGGSPPCPRVAPVRPGTDPSGSATCMCGARRRSLPAAVTAAIRPGKTTVSRAMECQETRALHGRAQLGQGLPIAAGHGARLGSVMAAVAAFCANEHQRARRE